MKTNRSSKQGPAITGAGRIRVSEYWDRSISSLAAEAIRLAVANAGDPPIDAIYIGNAFGTILSRQANLGALIAAQSGYRHLESSTFEAAGASGAAAVRAACLAVESGFVGTAVAVGVEKISDVVTSEAEDAKNLTLNYEYETAQGVTADGQSALTAARYLKTYDQDRSIFRSLVLNSYENAKKNRYSRNNAGLSPNVYDRQNCSAAPLGLFDIAQLSDGAAAVVITRAASVENGGNFRPIRILASANATSQLSIHDRRQLLVYSAAAESASCALNQAAIRLKNIDAFELSDATAIDLILSLEAIGLCRPGFGWKADRLALNQGGGNIGRGNPTGASGIYQIAEAIDWLHGQPAPKTVFVQSLGGAAATAITHILASE